MTPHLTKIELFNISGHTTKFGDELFHVKSHYKQDYVMKPVQCPHQTQIYASRVRSYRDLPIRYMESEKQYRDEKPGEISGLSRVIAITVEDGHSFCRVDQVKKEIISMINIIRDFYKSLGLWNSRQTFLSIRDKKHLDKYIGEEKDWAICEKMLQEVSNEMKLGAKVQEGEAALYGPKIDFMFKDALGKEVQIPTVQLDFATCKRFNLVYTDAKGKQVNPVMVHRAILGSYERFIALLIEHFAGAFPLWLSPVQVKIISVGKSHVKFCAKLAEELKAENIRVEVDLENETVGKKIHQAITEKVPYVIVIGDKEIKSKKLAVRDRSTNKVKQISQKRFIEEIKKKTQDRR
jgi:threonyl-tRNA synthetase